ncbi:MAG: hypothetical protein KBD94_10805 [Pyrinomonadaceae bacterium]|nr:hypothetical protein [Pyrinomonadaceae bacterium]
MKIRLIFGGLLLLMMATAVAAQKEYPISGIQGSKNFSPREREIVKTSGVVTARTRTGFFIQTPDDKVDSDPMTSEGILVYTRDEPGAEAAIGNMVVVSGQVQEFKPRSEPNTLPITEISMQRGRDVVQVLGKDNPLPKAIVLTLDDFKLNSIDQLEKYEGMRVIAPELTVCSPTDGRVDNKNNRSESNGVFYGVLKGIPNPFREQGYELYDFLFLNDKEQAEFKKAYPKMRFFDGNPERLRIESAAQLGSQPINVQVNTELKNVTGVMHYAYRTWSVLLDAATRPAVASMPKQINLPVAGERQFTVAGMNLENFFDDEDDPAIKEDIVTTESFNARMKKISAAIRGVMQSPDVIGIVESENLSALKRLAARINADTVAGGKPDPKYEAYLVEGNDGRGIDNGFLVKSSRVKVIDVKQFGKDEKFKNANTKEDNFLNDRPPLVLRGSVDDTKTGQPFEFTVVVNHLKSFLGYNDPKQQDNVRLKKRLQAEFLAKWIQDRQKANPAERIMLIGDFNAYQFNDGIVDLIGAIKGSPSAKDAVLNPSEDLVEPNMIDLVDLIPADQKYSYRFDGNGQVLDHIIISDSLMPYAQGFGFARVNADFPESYRGEDRPERYSDHDPAVAYFNLDAKPAPVPTATPKP